MPILEVSTADQILVATGDTPLLEIWDAVPKGLFPPFPMVELPGGLGGLLERGGFGQTFFFGSEVLGLEILSPKGRIIQAGGRVVKNVQGYDLVRPFVGSFGTLGSVKSATLRLRPGRASVFLRKVAELDNPTFKPRFMWQYLHQTFGFHFGHPIEVRKIREEFGGEEITEPQDYTSLFPDQMGTGFGTLKDLRFGWANTAERPPIPEAFKKLISAL